MVCKPCQNAEHDQCIAYAHGELPIQRTWCDCQCRGPGARLIWSRDLIGTYSRPQS